jgi:hypothetical protein
VGTSNTDAFGRTRAHVLGSNRGRVIRCVSTVGAVATGRSSRSSLHHSNVSFANGFPFLGGLRRVKTRQTTFDVANRGKNFTCLPHRGWLMLVAFQTGPRARLPIFRPLKVRPISTTELDSRRTMA